MRQKAIANLYEALVVFIFISGLILLATGLQNNPAYDFSKTAKKNKMEITCLSLYNADYFYTANASYVRQKAKEYMPGFGIDVTIKNQTDKTVISSDIECRDNVSKYCTSYILSSQHKNSSIYDPIKIIVCGC